MEKPNFMPKLGRAPLGEQPRPSQQPTGARWWPAGLARVRPHPRRHLFSPCCSGGCLAACIGRFGWFPIFPMPNRPCCSIKEGVDLPPNTHNVWSYAPHFSTCTLLVFSSILWARQSYIRELGSLEEEQLWYEYNEEFFHRLVLVLSI